MMGRGAPEPDRDPSDTVSNAYSAELERAILAVVLDGRHPDAWTTVLEGSDGPLAFYVRDHRLLALVIDQLATIGQPISAETVAQRAKQTRFAEAIEALKRLEGDPRPRLRTDDALAHEDSVLAAIGGYSGLSAIAETYAQSSGLAANVAYLAGYHRQRRAIALMLEAARRIQAVDGAKHANAIAEDVITGLSGIAGSGQGVDSIGRGGLQALAEYREIVTSGSEPRGALFGVKPLDEAGVLRPGALVILAARPGCGKTSMLLQAATATHQAHGAEHVALVSLEMTTPELFRIIVAREIGVSRNMIERGFLSAEQERAFEQRAQAWRDNDILVKGTGGRGTLPEIAAWIRAQHRRSRGNLLLVGVDYLGLINGTNPRQNTNERLGEITRELKLLARDLRVCVLLLCQMSRESAKEKRKPVLTDLRDSGNIEQDADSVVFLWSNAEDEQSTAVVTATVAKNRFGPKSDHGLEFLRGRGQVFQEIGGDRPKRGERMTSEPRADEDHYQQPPQQQEP